MTRVRTIWGIVAAALLATLVLQRYGYQSTLEPSKSPRLSAIELVQMHKGMRFGDK